VSPEEADNQRSLSEEVSGGHLHVILIKATRYDDDGYPMRHWRGVLPSNTLACLVGLTEALQRERALGDGVEIRRYMYDEAVQKVPVRELARLHRPPHERVVVGFVGVQSNQFPRACDLARAFQREGVEDILIGGFHVSGSIALADPGAMPPEIQQLIKEGITVVKGEVEGHWGQILKDVVEGRRQRLYDYGEPKPDMSRQPLPVVDKDRAAGLRRPHQRRLVASSCETSRAARCNRGKTFSRFRSRRIQRICS